MYIYIYIYAQIDIRFGSNKEMISFYSPCHYDSDGDAYYYGKRMAGTEEPICVIDSRHKITH